MSDMLGWLAAEGERPRAAGDAVVGSNEFFQKKSSLGDEAALDLFVQNLPAHQFPATSAVGGENAHPVEGAAIAGGEENPGVSQKQRDPSTGSGQATGHPSSTSSEQTVEQLDSAESPPGVAISQSAVAHGEQTFQPAWMDIREELRDRERRIYRGRTIQMLRRYMRYSLETGRLPSLVGREFFRSKVTKYAVVTFEDRVIFVLDMEKALGRLDEFSRQIIARHILQEHDQAETARILQCAERTVRTYVPIVLDMLSEILLEMGLMDRLDRKSKKSCQGGQNDQKSVSDCEQGKNNF